MLLVQIVVTGACSSDLTLDEYATQVEALVAEMNGTLDRLDAEVEAAPSLDATKRYATERVAMRRSFVEAMSEIEPPDEATELHKRALQIMERLAEAEASLADRVNELTTNTGIDSIWLTPEGLAARAADEDALALCQSAQSVLDETQVREELGDVPWVPPEMKQVVIVTFGCLAEDR
jgi:hypothetical protein